MLRNSYRPYTTNGRGIVSRSYMKSDQSQSIPLRLSDEISILKKEKQNLIQEKSLLKAKIVRPRAIIVRHSVPLGGSVPDVGIEINS